GIGKFRLFGRHLAFNLRLSQGIAFAIFASDGLIQEEREKLQLQTRRVVHRGGLSPMDIVLSVFIPNLARVYRAISSVQAVEKCSISTYRYAIGQGAQWYRCRERR